MARYGIGIDTSCYTTSVAVIDVKSKEIIDNYQKILKVKMGDRGLRQSDAFFQHVQNLGDYFENCDSRYLTDAAYIAVSTQPRNREDSYMPVFTAGLNFAKSLANLFGVPLCKTDHQSGHLVAAVYMESKLPDRFLGLHLSGGTTEILDCTRVENEQDYSVFNVEIVGGTLDISVGQLIDRVGVLLGFDFPCGKAMEASIVDENIKAKSSEFPKIQQQAFFNISGGENKAKSLMSEGHDTDMIIHGLFDYVGNQLVASLKFLLKDSDYEALVLSGGVAANDLIAKKIEAAVGLRVIRGEKRFCTDNALGVAMIPTMKR